MHYSLICLELIFHLCYCISYQAGGNLRSGALDEEQEHVVSNFCHSMTIIIRCLLLLLGICQSCRGMEKSENFLQHKQQNASCY